MLRCIRRILIIFLFDILDTHPTNESPMYVMEHLATFTVAKETGIVYPQDGMRRLLQLEKSNGIWSQKMHFRMDQNWVLIMDYETSVSI